MNRRGFLGAILAAGIAPAVVRASSLMRLSGIIVPSTEIIVPDNKLLTIGMITAEALKMLEENLKFASRIDVDYEREFCAATGRTAWVTS